ncbi:hypothetical protein BGX34_004101 [Mortierella sp. NVP85]|nr:hypothetical protein BGX34_004101 [Mortierella sp. NVP85]
MATSTANVINRTRGLAKAAARTELDDWERAVACFDEGLLEDAYKIFKEVRTIIPAARRRTPILHIANSLPGLAKYDYNLGVIHMDRKNFRQAIMCFMAAMDKDEYFSAAFFQCGIANIAIENYKEAVRCFGKTLEGMRNARMIDYKQLGLDFKLKRCRVHFNLGLAYIEVGNKQKGAENLHRALDTSEPKDVSFYKKALETGGEGCLIFVVPPGLIYRPPEDKVRDAKTKYYIGSSKVIADTERKGTEDFKAKATWGFSVSGPMNLDTEINSQTLAPPAGLQRSATAAGTNRKYTDLRKPEYSSPSGGRGLGVPRNHTGGANGSSLARSNTEVKRPTPLNPEISRQITPGGSASAAPGLGGRGGAAKVSTSSQLQKEVDEVEKLIQKLKFDTGRGNRNGAKSPTPSSSLSVPNSVPDRPRSSNVVRSNSSVRTSPLPARSGGNEPTRDQLPPQDTGIVGNPMHQYTGKPGHTYHLPQIKAQQMPQITGRPQMPLVTGNIAAYQLRRHNTGVANRSHVPRMGTGPIGYGIKKEDTREMVLIDCHLQLDDKRQITVSFYVGRDARVDVLFERLKTKAANYGLTSDLAIKYRKEVVIDGQSAWETALTWTKFLEGKEILEIWCSRADPSLKQR